MEEGEKGLKNRKRQQGKKKMSFRMMGPLAIT